MSKDVWDIVSSAIVVGYGLSLIVCMVLFNDNSPGNEKRLWARLLLTVPLWGWLGVPMAIAFVSMGWITQLHNWCRSVWRSATGAPQ